MGTTQALGQVADNLTEICLHLTYIWSTFDLHLAIIDRRLTYIWPSFDRNLPNILTKITSFWATFDPHLSIFGRQFPTIGLKLPTTDWEWVTVELQTGSCPTTSILKWVLCNPKVGPVQPLTPKRDSKRYSWHWSGNDQLCSLPLH